EAERLSVVRALYGGSKSLKLSSKRIREVPECVSRLGGLSALLLNNNSISRLPAELLSLRQLTELNLGNNALKEVPAVLGHLESLKKLYLFSNQITVVPPDVIGGYTKLRHLSVLDNKLEEVPAGLGHLTCLSEINLNFNRVSSLPKELCNCKELAKLYVARNELSSLPEEITTLTKLQVLDVAGNKLSVFPTEFHLLPLKELYCEGNRFVRRELLPSELVARFVLQEDQKKCSLIHKMLPHHPALSALLSSGRRCAVCRGPFLTTWLECVHFVKLKVVKTLLTVPVRALLCSYKCFNTDGHSYYGVLTR
uniref:Leucine rich repeat containing 69 n=1 Tax=Salarias fasciatus TaxID=181472 RepID=A0A672FZR3_SALFA